MKKLILIFYIVLIFKQIHAQDFITRWDLSYNSGPKNRITFKVDSVGLVNYTWETIPAGTSGAGSFTGPDVTIAGLPNSSNIRLKINPINFNRFRVNVGTLSHSVFALKDVEQWGAVQWTSMESTFSGCKYLNISATDTPDLTLVTDMSGMFANCQNFNNAPQMNSWNTSNVTNMQNMFNQALSFNQPIGNWNTSNVTNMSAMFQGDGAFNQPIGNWNTGNVTNMSGMFTYTSFNQPIGNWNTSNVRNTAGMFQFSNFNQPIGSWDLSNDTSMAGMFNYAYLFNQPIDNWNTSNVSNMVGMFKYAHLFNQPIGNWNTSNVKNMGGMFMGANSFNQYIGNWNLNSNVVLNGFIDSSGIDCSNYSATLINWSNNVNCPINRTLGAKNAHYGSNSISSRNYLVNNKGWTIYGDSLDNVFCCTPTSLILFDSACIIFSFNGQTIASSGIYYDTLINSTGCDSIITLYLTINHVDTSVTKLHDTITANALGATYQWLDCNNSSNPIVGATNQTFVPMACGNYAVSVTQNGCSDTSTCYVISPPIININSTSSICKGDSTVLVASGAINYLWAPNNFTDSSIIVKPTSTTTYTVTGSNGSVCSSTATKEIIVSPDLSVTLQGDSLIANASNATYQWMDSSNVCEVINCAINKIYIPTRSGYYCVEVTQNGCKDTSDRVWVNITNTNCTDNDILTIEAMLGSWIERKRTDFHIYTVENIVCDPNSPVGTKPNTLEGVWDFIKTDNVYQAPLYDDFPTTGAVCLPEYNPFGGIFKTFKELEISSTGPFHQPVTNCAKINLSATPARVIIGSLIWHDNANLALFGCNSSIDYEPIRIVIDEEHKCITNYTLQGHFLYPGKVQRCLSQDGCDGKIKITTTGIGFTTCGDNWIGRLVKDINICTGKYTFNKIDERLIYDFTH